MLAVKDEFNYQSQTDGIKLGYIKTLFNIHYFEDVTQNT
jgi:hypothetical protein